MACGSRNKAKVVVMRDIETKTSIFLDLFRWVPERRCHVETTRVGVPRRRLRSRSPGSKTPSYAFLIVSNPAEPNPAARSGGVPARMYLLRKLVHTEVEVVDSSYSMDICILLSPGHGCRPYVFGWFVTCALGPVAVLTIALRPEPRLLFPTPFS